MALRVLGCSGGIGTQNRTTAFLLDQDVLIDAGTGVEDLSLPELAAIDHVFITHCHLDHIVALPFLIDSVGSLRSEPVVVHALPETIAALRAHIFNWVIWPDFSEIPHFKQPLMRFAPISVGATVGIKSRLIRCLPASHTVPAVGYQITTANGSTVYSGDTGPNDAFWQMVNSIPHLQNLIIETAFANREEDLAVLAKHLSPAQLANQLAKLRGNPDIYVTHLKPVDALEIAREVQAHAFSFSPKMLERGLLIEC
jgi:ribonuclease BN (tRNA processing enzyme)